MIYNLKYGIEYIEPFTLSVPDTLKTIEEIHSIDTRGLIWSIEVYDNRYIIKFKSLYDCSVYNRLLEESVPV
jgi:hypothetical protein